MLVSTLAPVRRRTALFDEFDRTLGQLDAWARLATRPEPGPALSVVDDGEAYVVTAEVPGLCAADLMVEATGHTLTVSAKRTRSVPEGFKPTRLERPEWSFDRTWRLPDAVDVDGITATLSDGIATIRAPKRAEVLPRSIPVTTGGAA